MTTIVLVVLAAAFLLGVKLTIDVIRERPRKHKL